MCCTHNWRALPMQFPKQLEGDAVRLIHHSVLRKDDLVNKLYEAVKASPSPQADQKPATDQKQQLSAEGAAQASSVTKRLLTHFLIYVGASAKLIGQQNNHVCVLVAASELGVWVVLLCRWPTSRSQASGSARSPGCRSMGWRQRSLAACRRQACLQVSGGQPGAWSEGSHDDYVRGSAQQH